jgi:hypothetical protein
MTAAKTNASRRLLLAGAAAGLAAAALPATATATAARQTASVPPGGREALPYGGELRFGVFREGSRIGDHVVRFARDGGLLAVDVSIDLEVRLGFIPLFRYAHRNREVWEGDRLVALDARTDDNGTAYRVSVRRDGGALRVDGSEGPATVPADAMPTSYWRRDTVARSVFVNTQYGNVEDLAVRPAGAESIEAGGRTVDARRYLLEGSLALDVWYADDEWAKLAFTARGSRIDYVRDTPVRVASAR